jgi:hypothetical protein
MGNALSQSALAMARQIRGMGSLLDPRNRLDHLIHALTSLCGERAPRNVAI